MTTTPTIPQYTRKDFVSDQEVKWCPGCGDHSVLAQLQTMLASAGILKENVVCVSGIGCSSRFPYYMNTYGFHSIHGRGPGIAQGIKCANPNLSVWLATGDGDALAIGGNHIIHLLRRNTDIKVLLFNNRIYGLTKGQYSPTSEFGKVTKSSPFGTIEYTFNPISVALGTGGTFVARSMDVEAKHMRDLLVKANAHRGTAFLEIYQNCAVFNEGAFDFMADKALKDDAILYLEHGKPLVFGRAENRKGLRLKGLKLEVVSLKDCPESEILVHNEGDEGLAYMLSKLQSPEYPSPIGVFYRVVKPTYDELLHKQVADAKAKSHGSLQDLFLAGETWQVK